MDNSLLMFVLQGILGVLMLFFAFIMNGLRTSVERVSLELKILNDAVLGKYITRDDSDTCWRDQRTLDHELRSMIQTIILTAFKLCCYPGAGIPDIAPEDIKRQVEKEPMAVVRARCAHYDIE